MILQNLHTHTVFGDGKNSPEEMVRGALSSGCASLGFSEHSPLPSFQDPDGWSMPPSEVPAYRSEILRLQEQYRGRLDIFLGLEQDIDSAAPEQPWDYLIGSVHCLRAAGSWFPVDASPEDFSRMAQHGFSGDFLSLAEAYYQREALVAEKTGCQIVGHFDLVTKFNQDGLFFDESHPRYLSAALEALDSLLRRDIIFEINTGAISRGYRTSPYPSLFLLRTLRQRGGRICITSDAHSAAAVTCAFSQAAELAMACGFRETWVLGRSGFRPIGLPEFLSESRGVS